MRLHDIFTYSLPHSSPSRAIPIGAGLICVQKYIHTQTQIYFVEQFDISGWAQKCQVGSNVTNLAKNV